MAKTQKIDPVAAKARKQKIMLGVIGAVLLLLAAIQGPKLMKQLSGGSATPAASAPVDTTPATGTPSGTPAPSAAAVAGIPAPTTPAADPTQGKLISFSLFATKDPFVQQVSDKPAGAAAAPAATGAAGAAGATEPAGAGTGTAPGAAATAPAAGSAATAPAAGNAAGSAAPEQPPLTDATLVINGKAEYLKLKDAFPTSDPVFELVLVKPKTVKIGVAGGAFTDGKLLVVKMDKPITLVNTATGARYQITLVYTGTGPETVESFTAAPSTGDTSTPATTGSSTVNVAPPSK